MIRQLRPYRKGSPQKIGFRAVSTDLKDVNPLSLFEKVCEERRYCDEKGLRRAGKDWNFQIAVSPSNPLSQPPVLRTVSLQRVSVSFYLV